MINESFTDKGAGLPILFIHGWMMSKKVWHYQSPLSQSMRMIAVDLYTHEDVAEEFSYNRSVDRIINLLDRLQIGRAILAGWSLGSQIAIKAALEHPERISGLILTSGTPRFCSDHDYSHGLAQTEARGMALRLKRDYKTTARYFFNSLFSQNDLRSIDPARVAADCTTRLPSADLALSSLNELVASDLRGCLKNISQPTLIIHGTEDTICPCSASGFMAKEICGAKIQLFEGSGHAPFITAAAEFNECVKGFARGINV